MKRLSALCLALTFAALTVSALWAAPVSGAPRVGPQMSSASFALDWSAAGEVSGGTGASANYRLDGTIGQMAATGHSASANYGECSGFQCVLEMAHLYLPVILR